MLQGIYGDLFMVLVVIIVQSYLVFQYQPNEKKFLGNRIIIYKIALICISGMYQYLVVTGAHLQFSYFLREKYFNHQGIFISVNFLITYIICIIYMFQVAGYGGPIY